MKADKTVATIVIPTTGDRAALVEHALWSVRRQTISDWEVFLIGDGVSPASREAYQAWAAADERIFFYDHPKHPRRGEEYRHEALMHDARSEIVCYLCDRDLLLPRHLEVLAGALQNSTFAHTLPVTVTETDTMNIPFEAAIWLPEERLRMGVPLGEGHGLPLSVTGHRLDFYKKLETGWSTTPAGTPTDVFMCRKLMSHREGKCVSLLVPTVIYLPRGTHPGWPVDRRLGEMVRWRERMEQPGFYEGYLEQVVATLMEKKISRAAGTFRKEIYRRLASKRSLLRWKGGMGNTFRAGIIGGMMRIARWLGG